MDEGEQWAENTQWIRDGKQPTADQIVMPYYQSPPNNSYDGLDILSTWKRVDQNDTGSS